MKKTWQKTKDSRIKKRGEFYWARFQKRGIAVTESLGTKSFATAVRVVDDIEEAILRGISWRKEKELFETAWPEFLEAKAQGNKTKIAREKTLKEYIGHGERFYLPHFGPMRLSDINEEAWEDFVRAVRKEKPDIQFANPRKYLMGFLSWAKRKGKIKEMPELFDPDQKPMGFDEDDDDKPGKLYSKDELKRLRDAAEGPCKLWIMMAQYMGMRSSEITQLNKNRIDRSECVIRLRSRDTKTGEARTVPIHNAVLSPLLEQIKASGSSPYLFPNRVDKKRPMDPTGFKKRWNKVREKTGIEGRFHDFKHSFITHALANGMNPVVVSKIVGTSILVIERVYLHLQPKDLVKDLNKFTLNDQNHGGQNLDKNENAKK